MALISGPALYMQTCAVNILPQLKSPCRIHKKTQPGIWFPQNKVLTSISNIIWLTNPPSEAELKSVEEALRDFWSVKLEWRPLPPQPSSSHTRIFFYGHTNAGHTPCEQPHIPFADYKCTMPFSMSTLFLQPTAHKFLWKSSSCIFTESQVPRKSRIPCDNGATMYFSINHNLRRNTARNLWQRLAPARLAGLIPRIWRVFPFQDVELQNIV